MKNFFLIKQLSLPLSFSILFIFIAALSFTGCSKREVGSKGRPLSIYFVPSVDSEQVSHTAHETALFVSKYISQKLYDKDSGYYVKSEVPTSYVAVVEAFGTKRADFSALNTFSYILAKDIKKYPIEVAFTVTRGKDERFYKGQIIARSDSKIHKIEDLKGKRFAYTDPASTSGYILPMQLFKQRGIELAGYVFANKHDNVVTMVYQNQVDAGATFYSPPEIIESESGKKTEEIRDARARVKTQFPDIEDKVRIIGFTQEIPNDPWVIRSELYEDPEKNKKMIALIKEALIEFSKTEIGKKTLHDIYSITGIVEATDDLYNDIRKVVLETNIDIEETLKK